MVRIEESWGERGRLLPQVHQLRDPLDVRWDVFNRKLSKTFQDPKSRTLNFSHRKALWDYLSHKPMKPALASRH